MLSSKVQSYDTLVDSQITEGYRSSTLWNALLTVVGISWEDVKKIVLGIIMTESSGDPNAKGDYRVDAGTEIKVPHSFGLGQIQVATAKTLGVDVIPEQLFDPTFNIKLILANLMRHLRIYFDVDKAVISHNAGSPAVRNGEFVDEPYLDRFYKNLDLDVHSFEKKKTSVFWQLFI